MDILFTLRPEIFSILILTFLIIYDRYCAKFRNDTNSFTILAVFGLGHCIMALITEITVNSPYVPRIVNDICHYLFYFFSLMFALAYLSYVLRQILPSKKQRSNIMAIAGIVSVIAFVTMMFLPIEYMKGDCTNHSVGINLTITFGLSFIYILGSDIFLLFYWKKLSHAITHLMFPLSIFGQGLLVLQLFIPEFLYTAQAVTLTAVGLFFAVENPVGKFQNSEFVNHNIIRSLSDIFESIYYVNMKDYSFRELGKSIERITNAVGTKGDARTSMAAMCKFLVVPEQVDEIRPFVDITTVNERLKEKKWISKQFLSPSGRWSEGFFIAVHRDAEGTCTNVIWAVRNIDAFKQKEIEYTKALEEARDAAEAANIAKTSFLSRMSHDIRTPLNGIIGLIEISERHPNDLPVQQDCRAKSRVAANHLLSLINDVLQLSKLGEKDISLAHEPFNMLELAGDVLTIAETRAAENGLTLNHLDCGAEIKYPYVFGSPLHVRQILLNILGNAVKYNKPNGSISCVTEMISATDTIVTYRATISDTGIGMSPEFMEHMFEPFTQESNDARSTYQGTGLGMAIVKNLVEKMRGTISVKSTLGEGSTFVVEIPFQIASEDDMPKNTEEQAISLEGMHMLVVEDNELNMEIAKAILEDNGAVITEATNGEEAVKTFNSNPPGTFGIILMDLMMPILDGFGATKAIRSLDRADAKLIPIVAMTANAFQEDVQKCLDAGMNGHISKPIEISKMLETIAKVIK